jgi:DNA-binding response OmpR family regulator
MRGTSTLSPILPREPFELRKKAPRLILGLTTELAGMVESHFRGLGWDVTHAVNATEVGRLARRNKATAVVLAAETVTESGLLTCAKLSLVRPHTRVVLVGPENQRLIRYARLAGAVGYLPEGSGVAAVARAVLGN